MEHQFQEGEKVLCFEPMLGRSRALYEAKVTVLVRRKNREPSYRLNMFEWNKIYKDRNKKCSYDHEVAESFIIKMNQRTQKLMNNLTVAAQNVEDESERAETISRMILQAYQDKRIKFLPPGLELDDDILDSPEDNITLDQVKISMAQQAAEAAAGEEQVDEYKVEIELADELKEILEHECEQIKTQNKLPVPRGPHIIEIMEMFMRHYANMLLFEKPKNLKDSYKAEQRLSLTKEVLEGLRCLFDTVISTNLLYNEEMSVHNIIMDGGEAKYSSQPPDSTPVAAAPISRRKTRSSVTEPQPPSCATPPQGSAANTPAAIQPHNHRVNPSQLCGRLEAHNESQQNDGPSAKKARHAPHLLQSIHIPNTASGRSTPVHNPQSELLMKEINEWRLVPDEVLVQIPPLPSSKYGAIHLLRLFVPLGDILTRMRLAEEKRSFLLSVIQALLSYLVEERQSMFDSISFQYLTSNSDKADNGDTISLETATS